MKKIAKQTLLFATFAMLASTPLQAMETAPADVQREVETKKGFFAGWTKDARERRLKNAMDELDRAWKPFMKCVKSNKDCTPQARTIRNILGSILALIVAGVGIVAKVRSRRRGAAQAEPREEVEAFYGELDEPAVEKQATTRVLPTESGKEWWEIETQPEYWG